MNYELIQKYLTILLQCTCIKHFLILSVSRQLLLLSETLREQVGEPAQRTGFSAPLRFVLEL
ncbi:hypothetical protein [Nostoc sp.]|uniref:hypothetical protein n=1 Tax=Nostoc sp. TaxID=1180 RepID=UPI002FFCD640